MNDESISASIAARLSLVLTWAVPVQRPFC